MRLRVTVILAACLFSLDAAAFGFIVAQDGSGDFRSIQEAIMAAPDYCKQTATEIVIKPGIYREKLTIPASKQRLHLIGEDAANTVISWDDYALRSNAAGFPMGTSATSTVFVYADDFLAENITFENSAGEGRQIAQACAISVAADRVAFIRCRFVGNQDTIYTYGKGQRHYFRDCHIEGTTDFIFGASTCWFEGCTILCKKNSYITAASTPRGQKFGYVFRNCRITAAEGVDRCYLGRPWRKYARTVFIGCELGAHILPQGWHDWDKPYAHSTCFYAEYGSTGEGARGPRVKWARRLSSRQIARYTPEIVLNPGTEEDKNGIQQPVEWYFKVF